MTAVLAAQDLDAGYHGNPVVWGLNLTLDAGEVVALLGPNGAGKTTTMLTLAGDLAPVSGHVVVNGAPTKKPLFKRVRGGLSFVTEERSVLMRLTVAENLKVGRCDPDAVIAIFPELEPLMKRTAGLLSGGEQQMLTLGRALSRRPKVILADELSLGLAPLVVDRLLRALQSAAREDGVGVLLVEQHVKMALRYADRAYVLRRGQVVLSGASDTLGPQIEEAYLSREFEPADRATD
jgi:branched-chain amino acid transport system ATP-binding protein